MNSLDLLATARSYLQKFSSPSSTSETSGNDGVPTELIDGLSLYENQLRKRVESIFS